MKRTVAATLLVTTALTSSGCVAWRTQTVSPAEVLTDPQVEWIRVTTSNDASTILYQPRIANDTISGLPTQLAIRRVYIPVAEVTGVATRYKHIGKTLLAGMAIIGGVALYGLLQSLNTF